MDGDVPICPEHWPRLLWELHFKPRPWPGPGPINYPPIIDEIMADLSIHTMSYLMLDQKAAQEIRGVAERRLGEVVQQLSTLHDQAARRGA